MGTQQVTDVPIVICLPPLCEQHEQQHINKDFNDANSRVVSLVGTVNLRWVSQYVTVSEIRAHFGQYFKIELLVLKGRVALKQ